MRRTSLKDVSSCFYMSILALADTFRYNVVSDNNFASMAFAQFTEFN